MGGLTNVAGTMNIQSERLWRRLEDMARIGATSLGGCNRQALSDLDHQGRVLFERWAAEAGCEVRRDAIGNIFARRPGTLTDAAPVMSGSHLDTQPTGGKYDGVYGVLAALEAVETLNDHQIDTARPIDIVVWTNEEGSRFDCAMMGSAVWSGAMTLDAALNLADLDGVTVREELVRLNLAGEAPFGTPVHAAFELHIEQGPILEAEGQPVGVVTGVQNMCRYRLRYAGQETHAGPSPMSMRRDPMKGASTFISSVYALAEGTGPDARATFGYIHATPGSPNTVPGSVELTLDLRHPDAAVYARFQAEAESLAATAARQGHLSLEIDRVWEAPGVTFDRRCVAHVRQAVEHLGFSAFDMVSGAGHDACNLASVAPTSMIFIPCRDGLSHNEAEHISQHQAADGANVLLHAIAAAANET